MKNSKKLQLYFNTACQYKCSSTTYKSRSDNFVTPPCQSYFLSVGYEMHPLIFFPRGSKQSRHNWNQVANLEIWQIKVRTRCVVRRHRFDLILSHSLCFSISLISLSPRSLIHSQVGRGTWMPRIVNSQNDICDHGLFENIAVLVPDGPLKWFQSISPSHIGSRM